MKHNFITLMLVLSLTFSITACGGTETEVPAETPATEEIETTVAEAEKVEEVETENISIDLIAGEQSEYGELITMNEGTDIEESFYVYYVPNGTYEVTNNGEHMTQVNVYEGFVKNDETGYDEYTTIGDIILLDVGATDTIEVPDGWFIEIHEPTYISLTLTNKE